MDLSRLSDETLLGKVEAFAESERFNLIDLLVHLGELDTRAACQSRGYPSVFAFLTRRLGYAECDAMRRVRTARAARRFPSILRMLARGELHLVSVSLLEPFLTSENHESLLRKAARRSTREVERLAAELSPAAALPRDRIRPLPEIAPPAVSAEAHHCPLLERRSFEAGSAPAEYPQEGFPSGVNAVIAGGGAASLEGLPSFASDIQPAAAPTRRVVFTFTAKEEVQSWFEEARDLLRHRFPMGRLEEVIGEALKRLVEDERPGNVSRRRDRAPSAPASRHIPKWVRDEVWQRDSGRCAFVASDGLRCGETAWLEWDHLVPWALGGPSDDPANIRLLCRAHNQAEAKRILGQLKPSG